MRYRDILGIMVSDYESEAIWGQFFLSLKNRNLQGLDLIVSDVHKGLVKVAQNHFQGIQFNDKDVKRILPVIFLIKRLKKPKIN